MPAAWPHVGSSCKELRSGYMCAVYFIGLGLWHAAAGGSGAQVCVNAYILPLLYQCCDCLSAKCMQGYGTLLMEAAERIARVEHRSTKVAVISGVGTRHYYRKLGYELEVRFGYSWGEIPHLGADLFSCYMFSSSSERHLCVEQCIGGSLWLLHDAGESAGCRHCR